MARTSARVWSRRSLPSSRTISRTLVGGNGLAFDAFDGGEFFAILDEIEAAAFAGFAWIGYRIL